MIWKTISIISLVLVFALVVTWLVQGRQYFTQDKEQKIVKVKDEIFGTETEKIEWIDNFRLGLLPGSDESIPKMFVSVAVPGSMLTAIALGSFFMGRRAKKQLVTKQ